MGLAGSTGLKVLCLAAYLPLVLPFATDGTAAVLTCSDGCTQPCAGHEDHDAGGAPDANKCPCPLCPARDGQGACTACFLCVKCLASTLAGIFDDRLVLYTSFGYVPSHSEPAGLEMLKPPRL